jgi:hypothetical protein
LPYEDARTGGRSSARHRLPLALPFAGSGSRPRRPPSERLRRVVLAAAAVLVAGVTALVMSTYRGEHDTYGAAGDPVVIPAMTVPTGPARVIPAATSESPAAHSPVVSRRPAARRTSSAPVAAPVVDLNIGDTVGLEVWGEPGLRVRHRNFLGRADPISSASSALDRADATFRVRSGLGDHGCVSLESVNYPGSFLRHRNFVIHLDHRDGSPLFDQDATFCPQPVRDGSAVTLASVNFPDRAVTLHADSTLHLDVGPGTALVVRKPL